MATIWTLDHIYGVCPRPKCSVLILQDRLLITSWCSFKACRIQATLLFGFSDNVAAQKVF